MDEEVFDFVHGVVPTLFEVGACVARRSGGLVWGCLGVAHEFVLQVGLDVGLLLDH